MPSALVDVVIVNWNSGSRLRACLRAVAGSHEAVRLHAIVVDNASIDGSDCDLAAAPAALTIIRNSANRGFGAACNAGASAGDAPAILFLNPDTAVSAAAIGEAAAYLAAHPAIGIVGARLVDQSGKTLRTTARHPTPGSLLGQAIGLDRIVPRWVPPHFKIGWDHATTRPVQAVMGAFLMVRRDLFTRLGGFDERFFVYFEDADLCLRADGAGAGIVHLASAPVEHEGGGTTRQVKDLRSFYFMRSKFLFLAKHHGRGAAWRQLAADLALQVPLRAARALMSGSPGEASASLRAGAMLARALPALAGQLRAGR